MNSKIRAINFIVTTVLLQVVYTLPVKVLSPVEVPLVTFDGAESTTFKFHALNDPVMVSPLLHLMIINPNKISIITNTWIFNWNLNLFYSIGRSLCWVLGA